MCCSKRVENEHGDNTFGKNDRAIMEEDVGTTGKMIVLGGNAPNGPPPLPGLLVWTGSRIFLMVLDRFRRVDGLVRTSRTISLNGPGVEFE